MVHTHTEKLTREVNELRSLTFMEFHRRQMFVAPKSCVMLAIVPTPCPFCRCAVLLCRAITYFPINSVGTSALRLAIVPPRHHVVLSCHHVAPFCCCVVPLWHRITLFDGTTARRTGTTALRDGKKGRWT